MCVKLYIFRYKEIFTHFRKPFVYHNVNAFNYVIFFTDGFDTFCRYFDNSAFGGKRMKVTGIVAEYNPFHNGHKYHLDMAGKITGSDYTIVVMSGNFVQRGTPALIDKFARAESALRCGADLVLELPVIYAASSAEFFAKGSIRLLDKLGVITHLCFGSESGDLDILRRIAAILYEEPEEYRELLRDRLRRGLSYPTARTEALLQFCPELDEFRSVLTLPNNILSIEYLKALLYFGSSIEPVTLTRQGSDYNDAHISDEHKHCSALAIRQALCAGQDVSVLNSKLPVESFEILKTALTRNGYADTEMLTPMLYYKLLSMRSEGYTQYLDVSDALSDRILSNLEYFTSFDDFCNRLKSKDMTYTRISRCLIHILLDLKKEDLQKCKQMDYVPYARILGFRRESSDLLSAIRRNASLPMITKLADASAQLNPDARNLLNKDILASDIYHSSLAFSKGAQKKSAIPNEYRTPIVIV